MMLRIIFRPRFAFHGKSGVRQSRAETRRESRAETLGKSRGESNTYVSNFAQAIYGRHPWPEASSLLFNRLLGRYRDQVRQGKRPELHRTSQRTESVAGSCAARSGNSANRFGTMNKLGG